MTANFWYEPLQTTETEISSLIYYDIDSGMQLIEQWERERDYDIDFE